MGAGEAMADVLDSLEKHGMKGGVVSIGHLEELRAEVRGLHDRGELNDDVYRERIQSYLEPRRPPRMNEMRSIIVVATPVPQLKVTFHWKGEAVEAVVPPTYARTRQITEEVRGILRESVGPDHRLARAVLPVKLLAVRSGLAMYGRNNVTYVEGMGSFHRLTAFYSDLECRDDHWHDMRALPKCTSCMACLRACPTGAITGDRFLLRAERCLTHMNEKDSSESFPSWVKPEWHNSIVGCMLCQRACPYNRDALRWAEEGVSFTEEETASLLRRRCSGRPEHRIRRKVVSAGLDISTFPRNLTAILQRSDEECGQAPIAVRNGYPL